MTVRARGTRLLETGALGSAVVASICCIGPLVFALLGLSGGVLLLKFAPFRPYFLVATALFLGAAFYVAYGRPVAEDCQPGSACARPTTGRGQKIALWVVTFIAALAALFPYYANYGF